MNPTDPTTARESRSAAPDTRGLIERLASRATPVHRLWSPRLRLLVWMAVLLAFAAWTLSAGGRPDLAQQWRSPAYLLELAFLTLAALALARAGLGAAVPGEPIAMALAVGIVTALIGASFTARHAVDPHVALDTFAATGLPCALKTALLSALPTIWLFAALYRGWPLRPGTAAGVAGAAGFLTGFAMMRLLCPLDDALHIAIWHWTAVVAGVTVAGLAGIAILGRRTRRVAVR